MKKSIKVEKEFPHPIEKVWRAITDPKALAQWFVPGTFEARVGASYQFENEFTKVKGTVLQVEAPVLLVYTWLKNDTGIETTVHWRLEENALGTLLIIEHFGIEKYERSAHGLILATTEGWNYVIIAIENYLKQTKIRNDAVNQG